MREWMQTYLEQVRKQIRWKQAHAVVLRELQEHLQDQYEGCLQAGLSEAEAQAEAVRQMGDPVCVGQELNRIHRPQIAWEILAAAAGMMSVSLVLYVFVFYRNNSNWSLNHWLWTPVCAIGLGTVFGALLAHLDMNKVAEKARYFCGAAVFLVTITIALDTRINGVRYWSQYAAMVLPLAYGGAVYSLRSSGRYGFLISIGLLALLLALLSLSGSMWPMMCLGVSAVAILLTANGHGVFGAKKKQHAGMILTGFAAIAGVVLYASRDRLSAMLNPISAGLEENFQRHYILGLLSHSHPLGEGDPFALVEGAMMISPENMLADSVLSTDYLLAAVSYLCGWAVAAALLCAVIVMLALLLRRGLQQKTLWGKLVASAVIVPLLVQTAGYVLANSGLPLSSFELPLLSYGGAYKVVDLSLIGLLFGVIRSRNILRDDFIDKKILTSA